MTKKIFPLAKQQAAVGSLKLHSGSSWWAEPLNRASTFGRQEQSLVAKTKIGFFGSVTIDIEDEKQVRQVRIFLDRSQDVRFVGKGRSRYGIELPKTGLVGWLYKTSFLGNWEFQSLTDFPSHRFEIECRTFLKVLHYEAAIRTDDYSFVYLPNKKTASWSEKCDWCLAIAFAFFLGPRYDGGG